MSPLSSKIKECSSEFLGLLLLAPFALLALTLALLKGLLGLVLSIGSWIFRAF
jgi:hypothetical protein